MNDLIFLPQELLILNLLALKPVGSYYDIGAYPTKFARYLFDELARTEDINTYAIEPSRDGRDHLLRFYGNNKNFKIFKLGIGDCERVGSLYTIPGKGYLASFNKDNIAEQYTDNNDTRKKESVKIKTLDQLVGEQKLSVPDIIKIDTEGMEVDVIRGGLNVITEFQPTILIELHGNRRVEREIIDGLLLSRRYKSLELVQLSPLFNGLGVYIIYFSDSRKTEVNGIIDKTAGSDFRDFYSKTLEDKRI